MYCFELILAASRSKKPSPVSSKSSSLFLVLFLLQLAKCLIVICYACIYQNYSWNLVCTFPALLLTFLLLMKPCISFQILPLGLWNSHSVNIIPLFPYPFLQSCPISPWSNLNLEFSFHVKLYWPHFKNLRT